MGTAGFQTPPTGQLKTILFSGRFDPPHGGHVVTIQRLGKRYQSVIVAILDYPEQHEPVQIRLQFLREVLGNSKGNYTLMVNKENFESITRDDILGLDIDFDVYGSGNRQCLINMENLGYAVEFVDRAYDFRATDVRLAHRIQQVMKG